MLFDIYYIITPVMIYVWQIIHISNFLAPGTSGSCLKHGEVCMGKYEHCCSGLECDYTSDVCEE